MTANVKFWPAIVALCVLFIVISGLLWLWENYA